MQPECASHGFTRRRGGCPASEFRMDLIATPALGRRRFVLGGLAAAGASIVPLSAAWSETGLVATPRHTAGALDPTKPPPDIDNDLVVLRGSAARAEGIVTHVMGRVLGIAAGRSR